MRIAIAIVAGLIILLFGFSTIRGLLQGRGGSGAGDEAPAPPPRGVRVSYWCENCGTELLVLIQGSGTAPRHCGESMQRREEVLREN